MDLRIAGRTALITGGAGGIGLATAKALLDEGAHVVLTDVDEDGLEASSVSLDYKAEDVIYVVADLTDASASEKIKVASDWDIDILVHTCGVTGAKGDPLHDISEEDWEHAWQTDFMSGVRVARTFIPDMISRGWGRVVFVASENATQPYHDEVVYNAAKAAMLSLVKAMGQRYAPDGVLVNAVSPAFIATDMTDKMMKKRAEELDVSFAEAIDSFLDEERPDLVLKRRGRAEEVAAVIAFLCSQLASFVVGSNYRVDGGSVLSVDY